jgi:hypothetical protein
MSVSIDQLTTEVIAEPQRRRAGTGAAPAPDRQYEQARIC